MLVLLIALSAAVVVLWQQMQALRTRVTALELGGLAEEPAWPGAEARDAVETEPVMAPPGPQAATEPTSPPASPHCRCSRPLAIE